MENFIIFGDSPFAERLYSYIKTEGIAMVKAFTQERNFIQRECIDGIKVIPFEELESGDNFSILIGIGYSKMNTLREKVYKLLKERNFRIGKYISKNANVYTDFDKIGNGSFLCPNVCIGPNCLIGCCNIFESGAIIAHDNRIGDFNYFSVGAVIAGNTRIENNCFMGTNCTVIDDIVVKNKTLIGSGANIVHFNDEYEQEGVFVGNPAKIIAGKRSLETKI